MNWKDSFYKKHENKLTNKLKIKTMPGINWGQVGQGAVSNLIGTGMGLLLEGHNDRRQLEQQKKLQEMQMWGNKEMMDYSMMKQMEMWKNTNYGAQMQEIANAGLNPALLYGKGGAGGTTTGSPSGNVQGATAPQGGMEIINMMMAKAQMGLIQAQTEKTRVEATKIGGVDTTLTETQTSSLLQGISESKTKQALTEVQTAIAGIEEHIKGTTQNHIVAQIYSATQILRNDQTISDATITDKITQIKAEAIGALLNNKLTTATTDQTRQHIKKMIEEINKSIAERGMIEHQKGINYSTLSLNRLREYHEDAKNRGLYDDDDPVKELIDQIILIPTMGKGGPKPISGFHKR